jgi:uncharacterized protein (DUF302 family)
LNAYDPKYDTRALTCQHLNLQVAQQKYMSDSIFVTKPSAHSVNKTMSKLESAIQAKGITIFLKINHTENARKIGMTMNEAQVILFGSPKVGTVMMNENIFSSLDLPLKIAIVQDDSGDVCVFYTNTNVLKERYHLPDSQVLVQVEKLLDALTEQAIN